MTLSQNLNRELYFGMWFLVTLVEEPASETEMGRKPTWGMLSWQSSLWETVPQSPWRTLETGIKICLSYPSWGVRNMGINLLNLCLLSVKGLLTAGAMNSMALLVWNCACQVFPWPDKQSWDRVINFAVKQPFTKCRCDRWGNKNKAP